MSTKKKKLNKSGFTLVEMIVTILIFSILIGGLYASLHLGAESWGTNKTSIELQQELRKATEHIKNELLEASPSSITNVSANGIPETYINFKIPQGVSNGTILWDPNSIQFALGGTNTTNLIRSTANGSSKVIATDISAIEFTRQTLTPNVLDIKITAQKSTSGNRDLSQQTEFKISLRN